MANRFSITPSQATSGTLMGLSSLMMQAGDLRERKIARQNKEAAAARTVKRVEEIQGEVGRAYQSNDVDEMMRVSVKYPEFRQAMKDAVGFKSQRTEDDYINSLAGIYADPSDENAARIVGERQAILQEEGVEPDGSVQTDGFMDRFTTPDERRKAAGIELAVMNPAKFKSLQSAISGPTAQKQTADIQNYEYYQGLKKTSPAEAAEFAAGALQKGGGMSGENALVARSLGIDPKSDISPTDAQQILIKKAELAKAKKSGFAIRTNSDGSTTIIQGPDAGKSIGLQRATKSKIEAKIFDAQNLVARADLIEKSYNDDFLTYGEQLTQWGQDVFEKAGGSLSPEQTRAKQEYSKFRRRTFDNLNMFLSEVSGAAVNEHEMKRLKESMPSMADGPTVFKQKMDDVLQQGRLMMGRYQYAKDNSLDPKGISIFSDELKGYVGGAKDPATPPTVTTQGEFDALAPGSVYIDDGVQYRKP